MIFPDIAQVTDKILARYIRRNHEEVIFYKELERTIRGLHQIMGDRKGHLLYIKNLRFSQELENH